MYSIPEAWAISSVTMSSVSFFWVAGISRLKEVMTCAGEAMSAR